MNEEQNRQPGRQRKTLLDYKTERAVQILKDRIVDIPDVQSWAREAGVSRRWLCKAMKQVHSCSPKVILRKVRYKAITDCLLEEPDVSGYCVALAVGLRDEKALYKFLSSHFDTSLRPLRKDILNGMVDE